MLGTGRCGSSLVHEVLARHPDIGFVSNLDDNLPPLDRWKGKGNSGLWRRLPPEAAQKGRVRFAPSEGYRVLGRQVSPAFADSCRDLTAADVTPWAERRFRRFFSSRAEAAGAPLFLHKFTGWPRSGFVHQALPGARFVHVVRDGRAVANSWLQMPWWRGWEGPERWHWGPLPVPYAEEWEASGRSFVVLAGLGWKILLDAFTAARAQVPVEQWLELRYEDVLADPRGSLGSVLDFLGLAWSADFETGFRRYTFATGRSHAFRQELSPRQLAALESSLATHLDRFGYPAAPPPP